MTLTSLVKFCLSSDVFGRNCGDRSGSNNSPTFAEKRFLLFSALYFYPVQVEVDIMTIETE